jgi:hypothetical protein
VKEVRDAVVSLASTQDSILLAAYGIFDEESCCCSNSENESSDELLAVNTENQQKWSFSDTFLIETLKMSEYNWFRLVERIEAEAEETSDLKQAYFSIWIHRCGNSESRCLIWCVFECSLRMTCNQKREFIEISMKK